MSFSFSSPLTDAEINARIAAMGIAGADWATDPAQALALIAYAQKNLDVRSTIYSPGAFTDEGLGGGDTTDPWRCAMQRPDPPSDSWKEHMAHIEQGKTHVCGYVEESTFPRVVASAFLDVCRVIQVADGGATMPEPLAATL